jgi:hypothetical protein
MEVMGGSFRDAVVLGRMGMAFTAQLLASSAICEESKANRKLHRTARNMTIGLTAPPFLS